LSEQFRNLIVETGTIATPNRHTLEHSLTWLGTGTNNGVGVNLILLA